MNDIMALDLLALARARRFHGTVSRKTIIAQTLSIVIASRRTWSMNEARSFCQFAPRHPLPQQWCVYSAPSSSGCFGRRIGQQTADDCRPSRARCTSMRPARQWAAASLMSLRLHADDFFVSEAASTFSWAQLPRRHFCDSTTPPLRRSSPTPPRRRTISQESPPPRRFPFARR